jgi:hypothetical protein
MAVHSFLKWNWPHYSSGRLLSGSGPNRSRFDRKLGNVVFVVDRVALRVGISPSTSFLQPTRIPLTAPYLAVFFTKPSGRSACRPHTGSIVKQCKTPELWPPLWSSGHSSWLQNEDVFCLLWCTNWIYICYVEESRPPLWSSGQSSWLQIRKPGFDSRHYQKKRVVGLERGPLSLVSTTEELLDRKIAAPV